MTEPITTELRGVMSHTTMAGTPLVELGEYEFASRCDAIDAVHANLEREYAAIKASVAHAYASGYEYAEQDRDGWVRLPKDADGVPIRVGDVMEWPTTYETFEVVGIGDGTLFYIEDGSEQADWTGASTKRHHHAPTVEDVLREFAEKVIDSQIPSVHPTYEEAIADYAAKLRLAGDAE